MHRYAITSRALFLGDEAAKQTALIAQCARWSREGIDIIQLREKDLAAAPLAALARNILRAIAQSARSEIDPEAKSPEAASPESASPEAASLEAKSLEGASSESASPEAKSPEAESPEAESPESSNRQGPKARLIPAWGETPGTEQVGIRRAESPTHNSSGTRLLINTRADVALATGAHGVHLTAAPGELTPTQVRQLYAAVNAPEPIITISCHTLEEVHRAAAHQPDAILFAPVFGKRVGKTAAGEPITPPAGLDKLHEACTAAAPTPVYALGGVTEENASSCLAAGAAGIAAIRLFLDAS